MPKKLPLLSAYPAGRLRLHLRSSLFICGKNLTPDDNRQFDNITLTRFDATGQDIQRFSGEWGTEKPGNFCETRFLGCTS